MDRTDLTPVMNGPDDPRRCQGVTANGQCNYTVVGDQKWCPIHGGGRLQKIADLKNYRFTQWQARINEFTENPALKSLREEIGILRLVLEETINRCQSSTDLLLATNKITDIILKIDKLVNSCHRMEERTGMVLDKSTVLNLAVSIVSIVGEHVTDGDVMEAISLRIADEIMKNAEPQRVISESPSVGNATQSHHEA